MKLKSLAQIHQQTLDILSRLSVRPHTTSAHMDRIVRIHNRYIENACRLFGVLDASQLTADEFNSGLPRCVYATVPQATSTINPD